MIRTLKEVQKGWIFYLITLGMALLVALFGPTGPIQILNMLTVTAGVLLMLGDHARWIPQSRLGTAGLAPRRLAILAAGPARTDGRAHRLIRRHDPARRGVLAV